MKTASERHAVLDAPFGSPEAGEVRVYRMVDGVKVLVREEDPFDSDLRPSTTLGGEWADRQVDGRVAELGTGDENAASWSDDRSDVEVG